MKRSIVSHPFPCLWLVLVLILLHGCGGAPTRPAGPIPAESLSTENINRLLDQARQNPSPARDNLRLQAVEMLIQQANQAMTPQALDLLLDIQAEYLIPDHLAIYTHRYGQWALDNNQQELARRLIDNPKLESQLPMLEVNVAIAVYELRARYFLQTEQPLRAIDEYLALFPLLLDPLQQTQHQAAFWSLLQQLSPENRQQLADSPNQQIHAWLELLAIATAQELDLDEQVAQLETWTAQHPHHPAAQNLPEELRLLQNATRERPQHIALLLPLSGNLQKAGEAVRDGFFAAYYQALQRGHAAPAITVIDSQSNADFMLLYETIADSGAQLIIGPLEKEKVALLKQKNRLPVLTLALNDSTEEISQEPPTIDNLFLFGLSPENEAQQIARQARQQHQRALVIAPNNEWGQRINHAFISSWLTNAVTPPPTESHLVLGSALFDPKQEDYSTIIQQALGIEDSQGRLRRIKPWIGGEVEFEPRRRQDIEMIFLAARPEQARQIKPLLSFHYAGDIPVYANSSVYSGENNQEKDNDLNGMQLLISPWLAHKNPLRTSVEKQAPVQSGMQNLYALGADTWRLHARLGLLAKSPQGRLYGNTGILQVEAGQRITRQQLWARVDQGKLIPLTGTLH